MRDPNLGMRTDSLVIATLSRLYFTRQSLDGIDVVLLRERLLCLSFLYASACFWLCQSRSTRNPTMRSCAVQSTIPSTVSFLEQRYSSRPRQQTRSVKWFPT